MRSNQDAPTGTVSAVATAAEVERRLDAAARAAGPCRDRSFAERAKVLRTVGETRRVR